MRPSPSEVPLESSTIVEPVAIVARLIFLFRFNCSHSSTDTAPQNPEAGAVFNEAMTNWTTQASAAVAASYDFSHGGSYQAVLTAETFPGRSVGFEAGAVAEHCTLDSTAYDTKQTEDIVTFQI
jgi:hypothetical protein